ncbi:MAG: quinol:cytochrome C oxidoreductase [Bacteroidales bacterium]|nr:quinol:cytochrome C oxidoreductase [Bacteroidales bacterium]
MDKLTFVLKKKTVTVLLVMIAVGLLAIVIGYFTGTGGNRVAANLLLNNYYFLSMALIALFFVAVHTVAQSGWQMTVQRVGEAMSAFIPVGGLLLILFFLLGGLHTLYPWTHEEHLDEILIKKQPYLNVPFFYIRLVVYLGAWSLLAHYIRKSSLAFDSLGQMSYFSRMRTLSAIFLVVYALTSVMSAWDWLMSLDPHWFSTLYGWYVFSSMLAGGFAALILVIFVLKRMGYLELVNDEHMHDLGKYLFGFSIFWAYLWFSQYMLIWYANMPEETIYFIERHNHFSGVFYVNLILNFVVPFLLLMTRDSKRVFGILAPVSMIVIVGHWLDLYMMIMPGTVGGEHAGFGLVEIGAFVGFLGLFGLVTFWMLAKTPLAPVNHPYFKESMDYHTNY